jgi:4a-hydroxytetrahydrobiopterin dehydratase
MTETLVEKTCSPCRGGIQPLTRGEDEELLPQAPEWTLMDSAHRIEKTFRFGSFQEALAFVQKVGELGEAEGHPDISFGWGYGTVSLRTKKIKGLHENDFIMAAKIDRLARMAHVCADRTASKTRAIVPPGLRCCGKRPDRPRCPNGSST